MSNPVASVVWPWREKDAAPSAPRKTGPSAAAVLLQTGIMAAIGAGLYWGLDRRPMGIVVWSLAGIVLISGFFVPPVFAAIERFGQRLGRWVGAGLTWGLLAPFYYLCFFPMHLGLKLKGKDPLCRRFPTDEPTYWTARKPIRDAAQYKKQF
ncbi:MAG: hypothetical protein AB7V14_01270 [Kiritimatiellia bacterium]